MGFKILLNDMEKNNLKKVYILYGNETYLKDWFLSEIKNRYIDQSFETLNYIHIDGKETSINKSRKSEIKTYMSKFDKALESGNLDEAKALLKVVERKLSRAAAKNTIHKNAASRHVSRLAKRLNEAV